MRLKTPSFWYDTQSTEAKAKAAALASLSALYALGHSLHQRFATAKSAGIPVVCIGNLVVGGSGKTPAALALMAIIKKEAYFKNPCFLSRGYGGTLSGPILVNPAIHKASEVGDEPLLLTRVAPTVISSDRLAGARFAQDKGFDVILMDDGLQNPRLKKDLSIVVIDGSAGFGNGLLLPAGPLRTPIHQGLSSADLILLIGDDTSNALAHVPDGKPIIKAITKPILPAFIAKSYYAFCGIANPEKFKRSLQASGLTVAGFDVFPDHYPYSENDVQNLKQQAERHSARLITTSKDSVRIRPDFLTPASFDILGIDLQFDQDSERLLAGMMHKIVTT